MNVLVVTCDFIRTAHVRYWCTRRSSLEEERSKVLAKNNASKSQWLLIFYTSCTVCLCDKLWISHFFFLFTITMKRTDHTERSGKKIEETEPTQVFFRKYAYTSTDNQPNWSQTLELPTPGLTAWVTETQIDSINKSTKEKGITTPENPGTVEA